MSNRSRRRIASSASAHCRGALAIGLAICGWSLGAFPSVALAEGGAAPYGRDAASVKVVRLRPNVYMLAGAGENIVLQTGPDGTLLVDAGNDKSAAQVLSAVRKITDQPIRYVVESSADPDAVGASGAVAATGRSIFDMGAEFVPPRAGEGSDSKDDQIATIVATGKVLDSVSTLNGGSATLPNADWPTLALVAAPYDTFFNNEVVRLYPVSAHDQTDSLVVLRSSDVIVAGDVINAQRFPTIDIAHGGSIQGEIAALNQILDLSDTSIPFAWREAGTYIIPAYGRVYTQADVARYRDMVVEITDIIEQMIRQKKTMEQIEAASPCVAYETEYGRQSGPWTTNDFVKAVYQSLIRQQQHKR